MSNENENTAIVKIVKEISKLPIFAKALLTFAVGMVLYLLSLALADPEGRTIFIGIMAFIATLGGIFVLIYVLCEAFDD